MENIQEKVGMKGVIKVRSYKAGTCASVLDLIKSGFKKEAQNLLERNQVGKTIINKNLIMSGMNTGTDLIIQALNGSLVPPVYGAAINYGAIGTGNTAPTTADTQLTAEVARTPVSWSQDVSYSQLQMQFFFADGILPNQTYYEFGAFIAGDPSTNSGRIFEHALFGTPYVKGPGVDTTIELDITL